MILNADGTATLTILGKQVDLPNPTFGQMKKLKASLKSRTDQAQETRSEIIGGLTETQQNLFSEIVSARAKGDLEGNDSFSERWEASEEDDRKAILGMIDEITAATEEEKGIVVEWWAEALTLLTKKNYDPDDLPTSLANLQSVSDFLDHVETTPFHFGLL